MRKLDISKLVKDMKNNTILAHLACEVISRKYSEDIFEAMQDHFLTMNECVRKIDIICESRVSCVDSEAEIENALMGWNKSFKKVAIEISNKSGFNLDPMSSLNLDLSQSDLALACRRILYHFAVINTVVEEMYYRFSDDYIAFEKLKNKFELKRTSWFSDFGGKKKISQKESQNILNAIDDMSVKLNNYIDEISTDLHNNMVNQDEHKASTLTPQK